MGKKWTEEEKRIASEKAKARYAATQAVEKDDDVTTISQEDYQSLLKQINELKASQTAPQAPQGAQITNTGLIGTIQRYNTDPSAYPDPCERLAKEPRLARFAFNENWELEFSIKTTQYTTLDNRRVSEPQFTVQLIGVVFGDDGEKTDGRYVRKQIIFFEDPESALQMARANDVDVDSMGEKQFLDEMRYLRVRDWLLENFYPTSSSNKQSSKKQMVIGNQVVDYYEVNSVEGSSMPFSSLGNKLKG